MKILIVEDKEEARYLLAVLLQSKGYDVVNAINGKDALAKLENNKIDLIISDILMPEMDGFKFCKLVKQNDDYKDIPFIFYTATYVDKKDEEFSLKLGADLFLRKPMPPDLLLEKLEEVISSIKSGDFNFNKDKLEYDAEIYKLYNSRLIKKLEDKVHQLEQEIARRKQIEAKLHLSLQEKEILLRELYHRTRNNMQVISSMLKLYASRLSGDEWRQMIDNVDSKIKTFALVHKKLYESDDLSHIDLGDYLRDLVVIINGNINNSIPNLDIDVCNDSIKLLFDTVISLGFVINELLINSIKHAFKDIANPKISIDYYSIDDKYLSLEVKDNGIGLASDFDFNSPKNIGLQIVKEIVTKQLQGSIEYSVRNGTIWQLKISKKSYTKRV